MKKSIHSRGKQTHQYKKGDILEVEWVDSWCTIEDEVKNLDPYVIKTLGYFSDENDNYISLGQNWNVNGKKADSPWMNINKKWIQKVKVAHERKPKKKRAS